MIQKQVFAQSWRWDSRTIVNARKRGVNRPIKSELVYVRTMKLSIVVFLLCNHSRLKERGKDVPHKCIPDITYVSVVFIVI